MCTATLLSNPVSGTYTLVHEAEGQPVTETTESLDEALDRAADLAIAGMVIISVDGPEGPVAHDLVDEWVYRKLAAAQQRQESLKLDRSTE